MERYVVPELDYEFPREDRRPGMCFRMWGDISSHEFLRLPMMYLSAWRIGGDIRSRELYLKYRDEALERSKGYDYRKLFALYPLLQMQYSLRYLCDWDPDVMPVCRELMEPDCEAALREAEGYWERLSKCRDTLDYRYRPWEAVPTQLMGTWGGLPYYNPNQDYYPENEAYYLLRGIGDGAALLGLAGQKSELLQKRIEDCFRYINWKYHFGNGPIYLLNGYWQQRPLETAAGSTI